MDEIADEENVPQCFSLGWFHCYAYYSRWCHVQIQVTSDLCGLGESSSMITANIRCMFTISDWSVLHDQPLPGCHSNAVF